MPITSNGKKDKVSIDATSSTSYFYTGIDTVDVQGGIRAEIRTENKAGKVIGPKIYFKYVKSKLTKTDKTRLHKRLKVLQTAINSAKENEQQGLYEFLSQKLVSLLLEAEADAIGCNQYVMKDTIEKYRRHVREDECSVHFDKLEELARLLGGEVGATRPPVDEGYIGRERQIGQTGVICRPEITLAFGISGAFHFLVGIEESGTVIAINTDPKAPIFENADYYAEADALELIELLIDIIQRRATESEEPIALIKDMGLYQSESM